MILLGTGTSVGVPVIGCGCEVCLSDNPRNKRTRCSAVVGLPEGNLLIDTSPELRLQMVREKIGRIDATLFTHEHADHLHGLDDLRLFPFVIGHAMPLYCEQPVERRIRQVFDYAFTGIEPTHSGGIPMLELRNIDEKPFSLLGCEVIPVRLHHGPRFQVLGFRFGNVAYCTDVSHIPESSMEKLEGLDVLVLDSLRVSPHPTHFCLEESLQIAERLKPKITYLTHTSHELEYEATNEILPPSVRMGYDGLRIPLT